MVLAMVFSDEKTVEGMNPSGDSATRESTDKLNINAEVTPTHMNFAI